MIIKTIINIAFIILAVFTSAACAISVKKIVELNKRCNTAIVLIVLHKSSVKSIVVSVISALGAVASILATILTGEYAICLSIFVITVAITVLAIVSITVKCGVLDSGVVVPYRFIDWNELYDYEISDDGIMFFGDKNGFDTVFSATSALRFDDADATKLEFILDKYKTNK